MLARDSPATGCNKPREIVSHEKWVAARKALLAAEKKLAEARAGVIEQRRALPWTRVEKAYEFDTPTGRRTLSDLFEGRSRLIVYHFMFAPEWRQGCPDCSRLADHFDGMQEHLPPRDATFVAISRAPLDRIESYRQHRGWRFTWVSSQASDFNYDYQVSYRPDQVGHEAIHGYEPCQIDRADLPGTSVFARNSAGEIFHIYSAYFNGGDMPLSLNYAALAE